LKLHVEDTPTLKRPAADMPGLEAVWRAFRQATGWQLDYRAGGTSDSQNVWSMPLSVPGIAEGKISLAPEEGETPPAIGLSAARQLAEAIGGLMRDMLLAQSTVWQREAELAAGIPVTVRPEDQQQLATRLESVLRGGAEAIGCQAAALYLLDDATSHLKLRATWRLPKTRFLDPPRPLRGAVADLEALVGHAVALEDTSLLPHWKSPEDFPAALCVPVSSASTPLGTLWFFANQKREFTGEQTHLAEIIAGRLVSDLEREVLLREGLRGRQTDQARTLLTEWQTEQRPGMPPLIDGWQVAGRISGDDSLGGQFFDWSILPDGRLAVAAGQADGMHVEASLTATTLHVALKSHATYPHDARQMLERLNEALWTYSPGNRFASLFYGIIEPETGELEFAIAGDPHALLSGLDGGVPLGETGPLLGSDPDARYMSHHKTLEPGESLVLFTRGYLTPVDEDVRESDAARAATVLRGLQACSAEQQLTAVLRQLTAHTSPERALVVVRRDD
jgi:serine phosphatase RsbU (regulator of sigma subunit)